MKLQRAIAALLFGVVLLTPLFYIQQTVYPYILAKTALFQGLVEIAAVLWLGFILGHPEHRPRTTPARVALLALLVALALTALLGVDPWRSFWSSKERALGVVAFLHFAVFAVMVGSVLDKAQQRKLLCASIGVGAVIDCIAFLQLWHPDLLLLENVRDRAGATFGNPTFLAGYVLFHVFIGIHLILSRFEERDTSAWKPWLLGGTLVLNIATLFIAQTRGDLLGLAVGVITILGLLAFRPPQIAEPAFLGSPSFYRRSLVALLAAVTLYWFTRDLPFWSDVPGLNRFRSESLAGEQVEPRLIALHSAWQGFLERPVLGWGWDNFNIVFNRHYDPRALEASYQDTWFDKPHNVVLELLVSGGFPLLIAYAALFLFFIREALALGDRTLGSAVIAGTTAYVVRNLFVFDTVGPLLLFFLLFGIVNSRYELELRAASPRRRRPIRHPLALPVLVTLGVTGAYSLNILTVRAAHHQFMGYQYFLTRRIPEGIERFKDGVATWSPYRWAMKRDAATAVAEAYFHDPTLVPAAEALLAMTAMEQVAREHPLDAYNHCALMDIFNKISPIEPALYLSKAEAEGTRALELSPDRQEVYFLLARTKMLQRDLAGALSLAVSAVKLDPNVADSHYYYGIIAYEAGAPEDGYREIQEAVRLGRRWKNNDEAREAANYFANHGHVSEAIGLYTQALRMDPGDIDALVKMGVAYHLTGNRVLARRFLTDAANRFDLTTSDSYGQLKPILDALGIQP